MPDILLVSIAEMREDAADAGDMTPDASDGDVTAVIVALAEDEPRRWA